MIASAVRVLGAAAKHSAPSERGRLRLLTSHAGNVQLTRCDGQAWAGVPVARERIGVVAVTGPA